MLKICYTPGFRKLAYLANKQVSSENFKVDQLHKISVLYTKSDRFSKNLSLSEIFYFTNIGKFANNR